MPVSRIGSRWPLRRSVFAFVIAVAVLFGFTAAGSAQTATPTQTEDQRVEPIDPTLFGFEQFGLSAAFDGDTMVVGARFEGLDGAAYVFTRTGGSWTQEQKLVSPDPGTQQSAEFGGAVAIDNGTIVVGASGADLPGTAITDSGAMYVFTRTGATWTQQARLTASDASEDAFIGESVAIDGDTVIAGGSGTNFEGAAYVFARSGVTWAQEAKLTATNGIPFEQFGITVDVDGPTAVVGANRAESSVGVNGGAAYVFTRAGSTWTEVQKLTAADAEDEDSFGLSVAIDGDTLVASATNGGSTGDDEGAAYVFTRSGLNWSQQQKLTASDGDSGDQFGQSVAIEGDAVVIGAPNHDLGQDPTTGEGAAYVFARTNTNWGEQQKLIATNALPFDFLGAAVDIDGPTVLVGAPFGRQSVNFYIVAHPPAPAAFCNGSLVTVNLAFGQLPTASDDVILGTPGPDVINAGDGNDTICGEGGADVINAGSGDDVVLGGSGADTINAGKDNDMVFAQGGDDFVSGGQGDDTIDGGAGDDDLRGNLGNELINGGAGDDFIKAGGGDDTVNAGSGADEVFAGKGSDSVFAQGGDDFVSGGQGDDTIDGGAGDDDLRGNKGADILTGGTGDDLLRSGGGSDSLFGGVGEDLLVGGTLGDTLDGGTGLDTYIGGGGFDECLPDPNGLVESRTTCEI